jgi:DNA helicase-2/ATP-dependent DNA helicase PcrA
MQQYINQLTGHNTYLFAKDSVLIIAGMVVKPVLSYRIAYLMSLGRFFSNSSANFTNKAAKEMKKKNFKIVRTNEAKKIWMRTIRFCQNSSRNRLDDYPSIYLRLFTDTQ